MKKISKHLDISAKLWYVYKKKYWKNCGFIWKYWEKLEGGGKQLSPLIVDQIDKSVGTL